MLNAAARRATTRPIRPIPTMPMVAPVSSRPSSWVGRQVVHSPARSAARASKRRRAHASNSANARSAVASVRTPGVCPTGMVLALSAGRSRLSTPTAMFETTRSEERASRSATSTLSVSIVRSPSARAAPDISSSGEGGPSPGHTSRVQTRARRARPSPGSSRVTKTRGRSVIDTRHAPVVPQRTLGATPPGVAHDAHPPGGSDRTQTGVTVLACLPF
jgi:hypothetical protein